MEFHTINIVWLMFVTEKIQFEILSDLIKKLDVIIFRLSCELIK